MNWLILVAIATILDAIRIFIDNYSSDVYFKGTGAVSQKLGYSIPNIIIGIIILIVTGFNFDINLLGIFGLFLLSGVLSGIAGFPYYKALEIEDSTNLGIFIQLAPILYLILGWLFLGETISLSQLIAFILIIFAPILIVLTTRKRSRKIKIKAIFYASIYVLIAVVGNLIFVKTSESQLNFFQSIGLVFIGHGIIDFIITYSRPKWRKRFFSILKNSKYKVLRPMALNTIVSIIKNFAYRGALILAPAVALASATSDSIEPIVIFFMGLVLTLIWPKFGREKLNKKAVLVHLIATILVVCGIILIQF